MLTRNYVPGLGRFTARDAVFGNPNDPLTLNQFAYARANPIGLWDPSGMAAAPTPSCDHDVRLFGNVVYRKMSCDTSLLGPIHFGLDLFGTIPFFGEPFDLANCGLYGVRGKTFDAAASCAAVVPIAGDAAKWTARACKEFCDEAVEVVVKHGDEVAGLADEAAEAATTGGRLPNLIGRAGEEAAGDIGPKTIIRINGRTRIADGVNDDLKTLTEVKNRARVTWSSQLQDFADYAEEIGYRFDVAVPPWAKVSRTVRANANVVDIYPRQVMMTAI
jgi:hypothetical protein